MVATVAFVTSAHIPDLDPDDRLTLAALTAEHIAVESAVWDDASVDWDRFDLAILRSTWDYTPRRDEFLAWARGVPRLANDADTVVWNTDKRYLSDLAAVGVDIVPTSWIGPGEAWSAPGRGEWVIKPSISAGSRDTGRYDLNDSTHRASAATHVERLQKAGRTAMIQPYLRDVDAVGETALIFFGGHYSHAVRKGALLDGPDQGLGERISKPETIGPREPSPAEHALAMMVLSRLDQFVPTPLYARVDLLPGPDGPVLIELELTEPSLFFRHAGAAANRFAAAVSAKVKEIAK